MKTNASLKSPVVRRELARAILASRQYVRTYYPYEHHKRIRGDRTFILGYFQQSVDNALRNH